MTQKSTIKDFEGSENAIGALGKALLEMSRATNELGAAFVKAFESIIDVYASRYPKIYHFAHTCKKSRIRKKNRRRLLELINEDIKHGNI